MSDCSSESCRDWMYVSECTNIVSKRTFSVTTKILLFTDLRPLRPEQSRTRTRCKTRYCGAVMWVDDEGGRIFLSDRAPCTSSFQSVYLLMPVTDPLLLTSSKHNSTLRLHPHRPMSSNSLSLRKVMNQDGQPACLAYLDVCNVAASGGKCRHQHTGVVSRKSQITLPSTSR